MYFIESSDKSDVKCGGNVLSSNPMEFKAKWACDKCGENRKWENEDLAGIENNLASLLDDNENDIKVFQIVLLEDEL